MKANYFQRVQAQTPTRFWINNVTREQARLAIEAGAVGCTQNPAYTWKMMDAPEEREYVCSLLDPILQQEADDTQALVQLQRALVERVARQFMPLYEKSGGDLGLVSIQGDPFHEDCDTIVRYARYNCSASPNIIAKIPVTEEGLKAIEVVLQEGISVNATEVLSVRQALDVCRVYNRITEGVAKKPHIYFSHITGIFDQYLSEQVAREEIEVCPDALWQAGIAAAKKTYWMTREVCPKMGFIGGGARGLQHFTEMVGADACITINWKGTADRLIEQDMPVVQRFFMPTPASVIEELRAKLPDFRKGYDVDALEPSEYEDFGPVVLFRSGFETAWKNALEFIAERRRV